MSHYCVTVFVLGGWWQLALPSDLGSRPTGTNDSVILGKCFNPGQRLIFLSCKVGLTLPYDVNEGSAM